ncbi:helix-turn-helix domain-containing protein (plasmid) [Sulfurimonas aquatica]|uniref:Helix-turn-helix domain-containing protein n=1 Tax=Sulfurimonas aquatica TaxID=2672570 RepID=A0A975B2S0_9BACT|nr:helix-turn-helix transcriptional regulator [Sulfurimonas aquatica]QSZ43167.1 helix-turn-helix domain-containing protein [Sulfurimonas aquatica]
MLSINIKTPSSVMKSLKDNFKQLRLSQELTQEGLASRSGVSLGSVKRFEGSGEISLKSLLKLAVVLECLDDFVNIATATSEKISSIDELIQQEDKKVIIKRGKIK